MCRSYARASAALIAPFAPRITAESLVGSRAGTSRRSRSNSSGSRARLKSLSACFSSAAARFSSSDARGAVSDAIVRFRRSATRSSALAFDDLRRFFPTPLSFFLSPRDDDDRFLFAEDDSFFSRLRFLLRRDALLELELELESPLELELSLRDLPIAARSDVVPPVVADRTIRCERFSPTLGFNN